jgi:hypothetical protein
MVRARPSRIRASAGHAAGDTTDVQTQATVTGGEPPVLVADGRRRWSFGLLAVAALRLLDAGLKLALVFGLPTVGAPMPVIIGPAITNTVAVVWAVVTIIGVLGLLARTRWGWVLTMLLVGGGLVIDLYQYLIGQPTPVALAVHVATAFYLNQRSVRAMAEDVIHDVTPGDA